jgi:hypothetical protein
MRPKRHSSKAACESEKAADTTSGSIVTSNTSTSTSSTSNSTSTITNTNTSTRIDGFRSKSLRNRLFSLLFLGENQKRSYPTGRGGAENTHDQATRPPHPEGTPQPTGPHPRPPRHFPGPPLPQLVTPRSQTWTLDPEDNPHMAKNARR